MSQEGESLQLPVPSGEIEPLGYYLALQFHPPIKLDKKSGHEFAGKLSEFLDLSSLRLESNQWTLSSPPPGAGVEIVLKQSSIEFHASLPTHRAEWYEQRCHSVFAQFEQDFKPQLLLSSQAMMRSLMQIEGDARAFIGGQIMGMNPAKLAPMERPLHLLGIRLWFPEYSLVHGEGDSETVVKEARWSINVKVESWMDDPSKLFLEADGRWDEPQDWGEQTVDDAVSRMPTVSNFLRNELLQFLMRCRGPQGESDD